MLQKLFQWDFIKVFAYFTNENLKKLVCICIRSTNPAFVEQ